MAQNKFISDECDRADLIANLILYLLTALYNSGGR